MYKFLLLPLLLFSPLFALPLGNPMDASLYRSGLFYNTCCENNCCDPCFNWCDAWSMRLGFYGDYVFDRHMELKGRGRDDIDDFEIYTNAAQVTFNLCNRLDIFAILGGTDFKIAANQKVFGGDNGEFRLRTETHFSWGIGGRLTIWDYKCWFFGIEGEYFSTKPDVEHILAGNINTYPDDDVSMKYSEWQVGIGASYLMQVGCSGISVIPYTGLKWSGACADFNDALIEDLLTLFDLDNNKSWGYAFGATLLFCEALSLSVEARFGDEKAVHANGQFRF